jgi:uncharacterized protein YabN with tetrapyrrole methylase and pyrophosphatase domain
MSDRTPDPRPEPPRFEGPGELDRALALVRFLRVHCPWDRAQTPESLVPHLLEETHEVVDAIREGSDADLAKELGDLLLNLAFQVVLGEEEGRFDAAGVYACLEEKMVRRHPQLVGLAKGLDPLTKAHRIQERVAGVGFDWEDHHGAWDKVVEELDEVREALASGEAPAVEEELGDLLFAVVNLTRLAGAHATTALDRANRKFHGRFARLEQRARERGMRLEEAGLEVLDRLWDELKAEDRGGR